MNAPHSHPTALDTMGEEIEIGRSPSGQALVSDEAASHLHPSGFDPSRKIKGLTRQQSIALLWCGTRWRRLRGEFNAKVFRGRGLRPFVEWVWRERHGRFCVRLTEQGEELLASLGVFDPPYFGRDFEPRPEALDEIGFLRRENAALLHDLGRSMSIADEYANDLSARDSDGSGEAGETGTGSTEGESAGPKDIAR